MSDAVCGWIGGRRPADRAIPGDGRLQARVVCGIQPHRPPAAAEPGDAQAARVAAIGEAPRPPVESRSVITVASGALLMTSRTMSFASVIFDRSPIRAYSSAVDRQVAELGQPAAGVLDVFVDAEDLLHHQHRGERPGALRPGEVAGQVPVRDRHLHLAGHQPGAIGVDGLRLDPLGRQREAGDQPRHHEATPGERRRQQPLQAIHTIYSVSRSQPIAACRLSSILDRKSCVFRYGCCGPISSARSLVMTPLSTVSTHTRSSVSAKLVTSGVSSNRPR